MKFAAATALLHRLTRGARGCPLGTCRQGRACACVKVPPERSPELTSLSQEAQEEVPFFGLILILCAVAGFALSIVLPLPWWGG